LRLFGRTDQGNTLRVKVSGDRDPGYGSTGKMLGQAAASLALDHVKDGIKIGRPGGFWTPATMFDERFIERLTRHAGLRFERI
ncbi:MAG: saccharopine dehydrogenase, partial [Pseudomonadota bacterium]